MQLRYLNKGLRFFDSLQVVPVYVRTRAAVSGSGARLACRFACGSARDRCHAPPACRSYQSLIVMSGMISGIVYYGDMEHASTA